MKKLETVGKNTEVNESRVFTGVAENIKNSPFNIRAVKKDLQNRITGINILNKGNERREFIIDPISGQCIYKKLNDKTIMQSETINLLDNMKQIIVYQLDNLTNKMEEAKSILIRKNFDESTTVNIYNIKTGVEIIKEISKDNILFKYIYANRNTNMYIAKSTKVEYNEKGILKIYRYKYTVDSINENLQHVPKFKTVKYVCVWRNIELNSVLLTGYDDESCEIVSHNDDDGIDCVFRSKPHHTRLETMSIYNHGHKYLHDYILFDDNINQVFHITIKRDKSNNIVDIIDSVSSSPLSRNTYDINIPCTSYNYPLIKNLTSDTVIVFGDDGNICSISQTRYNKCEIVGKMVTIVCYDNPNCDILETTTIL